LIIFSPNVSGTRTALWKCAADAATPTVCNGHGHDWAWFHLTNPGIISIPAGFLFGIIGTLLAREPAAEAKFIELEVRALTGAGAEKAAVH
jgi:cation/acetate symporter